MGFTITRGLSCVTGLVMYAFYYDCDPIARKVSGVNENWQSARVTPWFDLRPATNYCTTIWCSEQPRFGSEL